MAGYSQKELERAELLRQIENGKITQIDAARMLGISDRQMCRITKRFRKHVIKRVLVFSKRKFSEDHRQKVIKLIESQCDLVPINRLTSSSIDFIENFRTHF